MLIYVWLLDTGVGKGSISLSKVQQRDFDMGWVPKRNLSWRNDSVPLFPLSSKHVMWVSSQPIFLQASDFCVGFYFLFLAIQKEQHYSEYYSTKESSKLSLALKSHVSNPRVQAFLN